MCVCNSACIQEATVHATKVLDADYEKVNVSDVADNFTHLSINEQSKLKSLLCKHEILFDSTLSAWKIDPVNLELKPRA